MTVPNRRHTQERGTKPLGSAPRCTCRNRVRTRPAVLHVRAVGVAGPTRTAWAPRAARSARGCGGRRIGTRRADDGAAADCHQTDGEHDRRRELLRAREDAVRGPLCGFWNAWVMGSMCFLSIRVADVEAQRVQHISEAPIAVDRM